MTSRQSAPNARHYCWAALGMLVLAIYGSLLPFQFRARTWDEAIARFEKIKTYDPNLLEARGDWVISIVLFAIVSYLVMAALCVDRRRRVGWLVAPVVVAGCVALAIGIEFAQVFFPPRTVSINDIQVESVGGLVGVVAWLVAGQRVTGWIRRFGKVTTLAGLASRLLPGYLAVLLVVQLMPFDFVVRFDELAIKYSEGKVRLSPWPSSQLGFWDAVTKSAMNFACFVPLGLLHSLARQHNGGGRRSDVPWLSFAAPLVIEIAQFFVYSRTSNTVDVLTGMIGVAAGWRCARIIRHSGVPTAGQSLFATLKPALFLIWLGVVIYLYWRPFDFSDNPALFAGDDERWPQYGFRRFPWAPFADYYWGSKYQALDLFVRKAFAFLPLGVLGAMSVRDLSRRFAGAGTLLTALIVAVGLEIGRYYLPSRAPSTTDVLIACAGAWIGFRLALFIRMILWAESTLYSWPGGQKPIDPEIPPLHWIVS